MGGIDGFRMDALPYVNKSFYQLLKKEALADIYTTGEVVIGGKQLSFSADYQYQSRMRTVTMQQITFKVQ